MEVDRAQSRAITKLSLPTCFNGQRILLGDFKDAKAQPRRT